MSIQYHIHEYLRHVRRSMPASRTDMNALYAPPKEYARMPKIALPPAARLDMPLAEVLSKRVSSHETGGPLELSDISALMGNGIGWHTTGQRHYPSGGGLYAVETYLIPKRVSQLSRGAYHYHPSSHTLAHLWDISHDISIFGQGINAWAEDSAALIVLTANWSRGNRSYGDFSHYLGMLEAGHVAQNLLLAGTALHVAMCPLAGFDDATLYEALDLEPQVEQPVYVLACGRRI